MTKPITMIAVTMNKEYKLLDKGFLRVVDTMGNDDRIVASAKVSYGKDQEEILDDKKQKRMLN